MSVRLSVFNLPTSLNQKDFSEPFARLPGFKHAELISGPNNQTVGGIVEFVSYESADMAKRHLTHHRFQGAVSGIAIDFMRDEPKGYSDFVQAPGSMQIRQPYPGAHQRPLVHMNESYTMPPSQTELDYRNSSQPRAFPYSGQPVSGQQFGYVGNPQVIPSQSMMGYPGLAHSGQPGSDQQSQFLGLFGQYMASAPSQPFVSQLEKLPPLFKVPSDATNCLYIDGVPIDAKEREVAHIFRPYPGFISARLIIKEAKSGRKFYYCFVDFENSVQATIVMQNLQGYRFHKKDKKGLKISYATPTNVVKKRRQRSTSDADSN